MYKAEYSLFFLVRSMLFPIIFFMPVYLETVNITGWKVGVLMGESSVIGILMIMPIGMLSDRKQPRTLILTSLLLGAAVMLGFAANSHFILFIPLFLFFGFSRYLFQMSFDSLFFKKVVKGEGCLHVGRYQFVFSCAAVCGLLATAAILERVSFSWLYIASAAIYLFSLIPASRLHITMPKKIPLAEYKKTIFKPRFFLFAALVYLFAFHWGAEDTCYGLFLRHYLGIGHGLSSIYMLSEFVSFGLASLIVSRLVDKGRITLQNVFIFGILISGIALILKVNDIYAISMAMRMIHGVGDAMVMVVIYFGISKVFHVDSIGGSMSAVMLMLMLGSLSGSLVFSWIGAEWGYHYSFIICGVILILISLLLLISIRLGYGSTHHSA